MDQQARLLDREHEVIHAPPEGETTRRLVCHPPLIVLQFKKNETRFTDKEWGADEAAAFEDAISMHGAELRAVREEIGTRTMPEVVRFYGHWKKCVPPLRSRGPSCLLTAFTF